MVGDQVTDEKDKNKAVEDGGNRGIQNQLTNASNFAIV